MRDDPLWVDVGEVLRDGAMPVVGRLMELGLGQDRLQPVMQRLNQLQQIRDVDLHAETITGEDKTIDVVVELFNKVNSGGTKLSKGDLALAKICAGWPEAREELKRCLARWRDDGFHFTIEWLMRNMSAVVTGRAELEHLAILPTADVREGLAATERAINVVLNLTSTRLGLDHDRVLGSVGAVPLMSRFVKDREFRLHDQGEADKLLFWYVHALLWGRYAGSTETVLNVDLRLVGANPDDSSGTGGDSLDSLIGSLRQQRGDLRVRPDDFHAWSRGARFYPLLYMLTRVFGARDLVSGLELRQHLLGRRATLEVHHLFPKALLQQAGHARPARNALANFAFLTFDSNRMLGNRSPNEYFEESELRHPGALASQWIPADPELWRVERYEDFLAARRELLAEAANDLLDQLLRGRLAEFEQPSDGPVEVVDPDDEGSRDDVRAWMRERGLPAGIEDFELHGLDGREQEAVLDLAWPDGLWNGGERLALLLDEPTETLRAAGRHGFTFFTTIAELRTYVDRERTATAA